MGTQYRLQYPTIPGVRMHYYYQKDARQVEARVFPPHVHDELEIYVLIEGNASFMVEDRLYALEEGDVIVSKPNELHNCILNESTVHKHLCFWFDVSSELLFGEFLAHEMGQGNRISPSREEKARLAELYEALCCAAEEGREHRQLYLALEMLDILRQNAPAEAREVDLPPVLCRILNDMNRNFAVIPDLQYFTHTYYVSQSTLNRWFQKYLQTTPKLYLETKRLAHSRMLLREGRSVAETCVSSGFSDYSNFIRLFKKRFSITPKEYRDGKVKQEE
ncbi:MAG: AraC family transcriptional regulator [Clostridia bacterium]|nr:AraC family transcriptional regulator [Clostridia bacterium]